MGNGDVPIHEVPTLIPVADQRIAASGNEIAFAFNVARYSFSRSIPPKFESKLRRHKQRFGKIDTTVVLDKDETLL